MTAFLFIRHASCDMLDHSIAGRTPGVHLNRQGKIEAVSLVEKLANIKISAILCSPLERAYEPAEPLAKHFGMGVIRSDRLDEIQFGDWTGRSFGDLSRIPCWHQFNNFRSGTRIPGGELMTEVQNRIITELDRLRTERPDDVLALITHGDVIKAAVLYYAGMPMDFMHRIEISPASVSIITLDDRGPRILRLNDTGPIRL